MAHHQKSMPTWVEWVLTPVVFVVVLIAALLLTLGIFIFCALKEIPAFRRWYEIRYDKDSLRYQVWKAVERTERWRK